MSDSSSPVQSLLEEIYQSVKGNGDGKLASYIPELQNVDPDHFGIAIATVDGMVYEVGSSRQKFTIQSISKVFTYALALSDIGAEEMLKHVGVEPSGDSFNSIIFDEKFNRPFNPMVNAGAIATTALIKGNGYEHRLKRIIEMLSGFAGHPLEIDQSVYRSEKMSGYRNRAIAYLMLNSGMISEPIEEHLDLYFQQCSVMVDVRDLAIMAATLANLGKNPLTGQQVQGVEHIHHILSVMQGCGMYNFSGEWSYRIGFPAKSGVSGGIIALVPGFTGIGIYSPRLDLFGNSVRGVSVCEAMTKKLHFHIFSTHPPAVSVIRRHYNGAEVQSACLRCAREMELLQCKGQAMEVFELQGDLFFSPLEQICRRLLLPSTDLAYLILDTTYVGLIDNSVPPLLTTLREFLEERKIVLIIGGGKADDLYEMVSSYNSDKWAKELFFSEMEEALEYCENCLLDKFDSCNRQRKKLSLAEIDITAGLDESEIEQLKRVVVEASFSHGDYIIREGEKSSELYLLAAGIVSINIKKNVSSSVRLGAMTSGITFGELCLFTEDVRSASIIAESDVVCYVLAREHIEQLAISHPTLHYKILINVGRVLTLRLRQANSELKILADWQSYFLLT